MLWMGEVQYRFLHYKVSESVGTVQYCGLFPRVALMDLHHALLRSTTGEDTRAVQRSGSLIV